MSEPSGQLSFEVEPGRWIDPRRVRSIHDIKGGSSIVEADVPEGRRSFVVNAEVAARLRAAMARARPLSWLGKILKKLRGI